MNKLSAVVLTKNIEQDVARICSQLGFADEIVFVDDFSTDRTFLLAKKHGVKFFKRNLGADFAAQRNFALMKSSYEWVLFVDVDEEVSEQLAYEIREKIGNTHVNGYLLRRVDKMWGKVLTHGDNTVSLLRLGRKNKGKWAGKVHEVWNMTGKTEELESSLLHFPHQSISEFLAEISFYAGIRAEELYAMNEKVSWFSIIAYPKGKFLDVFLLKRGFLDGTAGFVAAIMIAFYSFQVRARLWEIYARGRKKK